MAAKFGEQWFMERSNTSTTTTTTSTRPYRFLARGLTDEYEPWGSPPSANGVHVLREDFQLDQSDHRSTPLSAADVAAASLIVGVTRRHVAEVERRFPGSVGKVVHLAKDVADPWRQGIEVYRLCAHTMRPLVRELLDQHAGTSSGGVCHSGDRSTETK